MYFIRDRYNAEHDFEKRRKQLRSCLDKSARIRPFKNEHSQPIIQQPFQSFHDLQPFMNGSNRTRLCLAYLLVMERYMTGLSELHPYKTLKQVMKEHKIVRKLVPEVPVGLVVAYLGHLRCELEQRLPGLDRRNQPRRKTDWCSSLFYNLSVPFWNGSCWNGSCRNCLSSKELMICYSSLAFDTSFRRFAVELYDLVMALTETSRRRYYRTIFSIAKDHLCGNRHKQDYFHWLQVGRRWKELSALFGDAIILAGRFTEGRTSALNIPLIVEMWSESDFQCIKRFLKSRSRELQEICRKLEPFLDFLLDHRDWCKSASSMPKLAQELTNIFDTEIAVSSLLADLEHPVGDDALARQLIYRLSADERIGSGSVPWEAVAYCVDVLLDIIPRPCYHGRGTAVVREAAVARVLAHGWLGVAREEVEYCVDEIIASFGAVIARAGI